MNWDFSLPASRLKHETWYLKFLELCTCGVTTDMIGVQSMEKKRLTNNTPFPNSLIMQKLEWHISVAKKHQIQTRWVLLCWYSKFRIHWKRRSVFFNIEKLRSNPYKKSALPALPRFQEIVNFQTLIKSDQNR